MWFTKAKRAQTNEDFETWTMGGVVPTLNGFDCGDTRTTVIVMREREGKPGGGKGPLLAEDMTFSLSTNNFHILFNKDLEVRRLTPTECERLQGFPDGWTDGQADSHRYKQMGNAVAVPVVQWIIERMTK
jgi:DNA (cytosine-5)-methyltransferase 1